MSQPSTSGGHGVTWAAIFAACLALAAFGYWLTPRQSQMTVVAPQQPMTNEGAQRVEAAATTMAAPAREPVVTKARLLFRAPDGAPGVGIGLLSCQGARREVENADGHRVGQSGKDGLVDVARLSVHADAAYLAVAPGYQVVDVTSAVRESLERAGTVVVPLAPAVTDAVIQLVDSIGEPVAGEQIILSKAAVGVEITEQVTDSTVPTAHPDAIHRARSDRLGLVRFEHLPPGVYAPRTSQDWLPVDDADDPLSVGDGAPKPVVIKVAPVLCAALEVKPDGPVELARDDSLLAPPSNSRLMTIQMRLRQRHPGSTIIMALGKRSLLHETGHRARVRRPGSTGSDAELLLVPPSNLHGVVALDLAPPAKSSDDRGRVTVLIYDAGGAELAGLPLSFIPRNRRGRPGASDSSQPVELRPGDYTIRFLDNLLGGDSLLKEITVQTGVEQTVEHRLAVAMRRVRLRVALRDGSTPTYAVINVDAAAGKQSLRSTRPGEVPLNLVVGHAKVTVHVHGYPQATLDLDVPPGPFAEPIAAEVTVQ